MSPFQTKAAKPVVPRVQVSDVNWMRLPDNPTWSVDETY